MTTYTFYWLDGSKSVSKGYSVQEAFSRLGYGGGAINALDFYTEDDKDMYEYDKNFKQWVPTKQ